MSRFVSKTLRKLPSTTREIARLSNEIASAQVRLANRVSRLAELERTADASLRVRCTNGAHASLVAASLNFVRSLDPETSGRARIAAIGRLKDTVAPFDPDTLCSPTRTTRGRSRVPKTRTLSSPITSRMLSRETRFRGQGTAADAPAPERPGRGRSQDRTPPLLLAVTSRHITHKES